ncbi:MAG: hypothetical protein GY868_10625, partial [Deltaproteobacteria bacterium]|nr:hypothetical protein [Deltaproteobacteria bacterium]
MKQALWQIRFGFICPGLLVLLCISFSRHFKKIMQAAICSTMIWTGFGITAMIIISPAPVSYSYYAGLILVFMYGYTFVRLRFIWATLAGWAIVAFYEFAAISISSTPIPILVNNNFFFISANIIGMLTSYYIELFQRRDFFLARLLEQEQEKVKSINRNLEKRVQKRTVQLIKANDDLKREITERQRAEKELIQAQKMEAIGTLAGGIAHDFNNILTAIISYSELGTLKYACDPNKNRDRFEQILKAGHRARDLVKQILTFSRQQEQERVPVN